MANDVSGYESVLMGMRENSELEKLDDNKMHRVSLHRRRRPLPLLLLQPIPLEKSPF